MNEITLSSSKVAVELRKRGQKREETRKIMNSLRKDTIQTKTTAAMLEKQNLLYQYQMGYILGLLKANNDCLPDDIAAQQTINGIPVGLAIKIKVDNMVLQPREEIGPNELTYETEYWNKYRRLSELICGFGYNMRFSEERFEAFFPNGMHRFVLGFAEGYSKCFHMLADEAGIETVCTDPKTQDIWKNWMFFLKDDVEEYRLDGKYLFLYHGGYNWTKDRNIPHGNNEKLVNQEVYRLLKERTVDSKCECDFAF